MLKFLKFHKTGDSMTELYQKGPKRLKNDDLEQDSKPNKMF